MPSPVLRTKAARGAAQLGFVPPLLPTLVDEPPAGDGWIHEIKHDGYRTLVVIDRGRVRAFTRNSHDWTDRYPPRCGLRRPAWLLSWTAR